MLVTETETDTISVGRQCSMPLSDHMHVYRHSAAAAAAQAAEGTSYRPTHSSVASQPGLLR